MYWKSILSFMKYTAHQACAYGGARPKWTELAWNHPAFAELCKTCPGESTHHVHQPWGLVRTDEGVHFSTSEETAYPRPLAMAIARIFALICTQHGWSPPLVQLEPNLEPTSKFMRAVATTQPKAAQMPPIVREHKQVVLVRGTHQLLAQTPFSLCSGSKRTGIFPLDAVLSSQPCLWVLNCCDVPLFGQMGEFWNQKGKFWKHLQDQVCLISQQGSNKLGEFPSLLTSSLMKLRYGAIQKPFPSWFQNFCRKPLYVILDGDLTWET